MVMGICLPLPFNAEQLLGICLPFDFNTQLQLSIHLPLHFKAQLVLSLQVTMKDLCVVWSHTIVGPAGVHNRLTTWRAIW